MKINKKIILLIVAHTDDESFGCGAFIKRLSTQNNKVFAMSFTNGIGSRENIKTKDILERKKSANRASKILNFEWIDNYDYPDNQLDQVPLLKIIKHIEKNKKKYKPDIVLTHNFSDLNIDHRIIAEATLTAFRPEPKDKATEIITFEIPSSTDFRQLKNKANFIPNYFVSSDRFLKFKIKAIKTYKNEIKRPPHSRSLGGVKNLSKIRGNQSGLKNAEAFEIIRKIQK